MTLTDPRPAPLENALSILTSLQLPQYTDEQRFMIASACRSLRTVLREISGEEDAQDDRDTDYILSFSVTEHDMERLELIKKALEEKQAGIREVMVLVFHSGLVTVEGDLFGGTNTAAPVG
jgi:hypothetical protein